MGYALHAFLIGAGENGGTCQKKLGVIIYVYYEI
jgi:hypothetical protein